MITPMTDTHYILNGGHHHTPEELAIYTHLADPEDPTKNWGYPIRGAQYLDEIATEHYGKEYYAQQTGDMLGNDTVTEYHMNEESVQDILYGQGIVPDSEGNYAEKFHYLDFNPWTKTTEKLEGVNWIEYWLALEYVEHKRDWSNRDPAYEYLERLRDTSKPMPWQDGRGHAFDYDGDVYRAAPTPEIILADLIYKGILPYGKYLLYVSW